VAEFLPLRYLETLIALELRQRLTSAAHQRYLHSTPAFYSAASGGGGGKQGGVDHVDQRIVVDIDQWATQVQVLGFRSEGLGLRFRV
jgi:ABC-type uncharacterized transport system fused permease/ATPase subunit